MKITTTVGALIASTGCLGLFSFALYMLLTHPLPGPAAELLAALIGALAAKFSTVIDFWVGSSAGSAHKTELLANPATGA